MAAISTAPMDKTVESENDFEDFLQAAKDGDHDALVRLLAKGADQSQPGGLGRAAIRAANGDKPGHTECLKTLLPLVDQNAVNLDGNTLLHCAAIAANEESVSLLIPVCGIDRPDNKGWTPLMMAAFSGLDNICKLLIRAGASTSNRDVSSERCALMLAIEENRVECVKTLLPFSDIRACDFDGLTPLALAKLAGRGECANAIHLHLVMLDAAAISSHIANRGACRHKSAKPSI